MKPSETLTKALDILNERGWCQGTFEASDGSVCTLGAVSVATTGQATYNLNFTNNYAYHFLMVGLSIGTYPSVGTFNDAPTTTEEDIKLGFKRAIELAEAEGM